MPTSKKNKKENEPKYDLLLVGVDEDTTNVCRQYADSRPLRLLTTSALTLPEFQKQRENLLALVLDDSVENSLDLLSAIDRTDKKAKVIIVTSSRNFDYAISCEARGALTVWVKPYIHCWVVSHACDPLLQRKHVEAWNRQRGAVKWEGPLYCDRCDDELSSGYVSELRKRIGEESASRQRRDGYLTLAEVERRHICAVVAHLGGDKIKAAHALGIGKTKVYRKLLEYGLRERFDRRKQPDPQPAVPEPPDHFAQLEVVKKQVESALEMVKAVEKRIVGR